MWWLSARDEAQARLTRLDAQVKGAEVQADASLQAYKELQRKLTESDAEAHQLRQDR